MELLKNWVRNLTIEDVTRWIRTAAQFMAGSGFAVGAVSGDKWVMAGSALISLVSFIFTIRGNTVASKVAEIEKSPEVVHVIPSASATEAVKEAATGVPGQVN